MLYEKFVSCRPFTFEFLNSTVTLIEFLKSDFILFVDLGMGLYFTFEFLKSETQLNILVIDRQGKLVGEAENAN